MTNFKFQSSKIKFREISDKPKTKIFIFWHLSFAIDLTFACLPQAGSLTFDIE